MLKKIELSSIASIILFIFISNDFLFSQNFRYDERLNSYSVYNELNNKEIDLIITQIQNKIIESDSIYSLRDHGIELFVNINVNQKIRDLKNERLFKKIIENFDNILIRRVQFKNDTKQVLFQ